MATEFSVWQANARFLIEVTDETLVGSEAKYVRYSINNQEVSRDDFFAANDFVVRSNR